MSEHFMNAPQFQLINRITVEASVVYDNLATISASIRPHPLSLISGGRVIDYHVLSVGPKVFASCLKLAIEPTVNQNYSCERWVVDDQDSGRPRQLRAIFDQHLPLGMFDQIIYRNQNSEPQTEFFPVEGTRLLFKRDRHVQESEIDRVVAWVQNHAAPQSNEWQQGLKNLLTEIAYESVDDYQVIDAEDISNLLSQQAEFRTQLAGLESRVHKLENGSNSI